MNLGTLPLVIIGLLCLSTTSGCTSLFETKHYITIKSADIGKVRVLCPGQKNWMGEGMIISSYGIYEISKSTTDQINVRLRKPEWATKLAIYHIDNILQDADEIEVKKDSIFIVKNNQWKVIDIQRVDKVILNNKEDCNNGFLLVKRL
ncbi:hypothetical protein K9N68_05195 [Kovacikia minuta CCNUW1]|uniref:hypothetical protein n=1 Tax=Kovacikia minuta TaxID=2931930 RepID=UPI001CCB6D56|nr:hypothetical protein [Kovacikia minuta]UBF27356.1 hypothetical protein K9N68_05195 [Kovacikia minuta CCNUW1]